MAKYVCTTVHVEEGSPIHNGSVGTDRINRITRCRVTSKTP